MSVTPEDAERSAAGKGIEIRTDLNIGMPNYNTLVHSGFMFPVHYDPVYLRENEERRDNDTRLYLEQRGFLSKEYPEVGRTTSSTRRLTHFLRIIQKLPATYSVWVYLLHRR